MHKNGQKIMQMAIKRPFLKRFSFCLRHFPTVQGLEITFLSSIDTQTKIGFVIQFLIFFLEIAPKLKKNSIAQNICHKNI